jgi:hypothetical protein
MQQPDLKKVLQWLPVPELPLASCKMEEMEGRCDCVRRFWFYISRFCLKAYGHYDDIRPETGGEEVIEFSFQKLMQI